jgi:hypothetical protein
LAAAVAWGEKLAFAKLPKQPSQKEIPPKAITLWQMTATAEDSNEETNQQHL